MLVAVGVGVGSAAVGAAWVAVGKAGVSVGGMCVGAAWQASRVRMKRELINNRRVFGLRIEMLSK